MEWNITVKKMEAVKHHLIKPHVVYNTHVTYWHNKAKEMHGWIKATRSIDIPLEKKCIWSL